jgi:hypothetical protein
MNGSPLMGESIAPTSAIWSEGKKSRPSTFSTAVAKTLAVHFSEFFVEPAKGAAPPQH